MIICWDNLKDLEYFPEKGYWKKRKNGKIESRAWYYNNKCNICGESFLWREGNKGKSCSQKCVNIIKSRSMMGKKHPQYGKKHSEETKKKKSISMKELWKNTEYQKKVSDGLKTKWKDTIYREKISKEMRENNPATREDVKVKLRGKNHHNWKGGVRDKNIPLYDTFAPQLEWCEPVRRNQEDPNILEVKCTWCGKWFIPKLYNTQNRAQHLKGNYPQEHRFYCSNGCKHNCPIWNRSPEQLMRNDILRSGRLSWFDLPREVQPELRKMVFERDEWKCIKCGSSESLHCHHIEGIHHNPIESADTDICVTVCKECHKEIHKEKGCSYYDMQCKDI